MKHSLIIVGLVVTFISACSSHEAEPYPVETYTKKEYVVTKTAINDVFEKSDSRGVTELKTENTIPADEEVCEIITGCAIDNVGKCIGCTVKKRDLATLEFKGNGSLRSGDYRITSKLAHTGKVTRWTIPLKMSLRNISKNTYLMKFYGIGKVNRTTVDCTKPYVATFSLNENNEEIYFKTVDRGSCPNIITANEKVKWESNLHGLKKMKSYSNGECHVGPCDWISTKINVYFYERI
jgi:hypothetical protein